MSQITLTECDECGFRASANYHWTHTQMGHDLCLTCSAKTYTELDLYRNGEVN